MEDSELFPILTVGAELQGIGNSFFLPAFICQVEMRSWGHKPLDKQIN